MLRRRHARPDTRDRWLLSYADFITLLFAFFTTLYAASAVDATQREALAAGLREAVGRRAADGGADRQVSAAPPAHPAAVPPAEQTLSESKETALARAAAAQMAEARHAIEQELAGALAAGQLELTQDRRGLVVAVPEAAAFETGQAVMSTVARAVLQQLATTVGRLPNAIRVEGHTDDTPISTAKYASNWELSTARATQVIELFIGSGITPERLSAAGYAEHRPKVANQSPEARARNRRVDIVVLNLETSALEEPATGAIP